MGRRILAGIIDAAKVKLNTTEKMLLAQSKLGLSNAAVLVLKVYINTIYDSCIDFKRR